MDFCYIKAEKRSLMGGWAYNILCSVLCYCTTRVDGAIDVNSKSPRKPFNVNNNHLSLFFLHLPTYHCTTPITVYSLST